MNVVSDGGLERIWTFMVYLAGDNNLESYGVKDLLEMKQAGSSGRMAIIAQFDRMSDQVTRRYHLSQSGDLHTDCIAELTETNTGDPQALLDFILWATHTYPAQHYALVLWNHGSGWKDEDIYQAAQRLGLDSHIPRGNLRSVSSGKASRALFRTTLDQIVIESTQRAILYDDNSADFLDNQEMSQVLRQANAHIGQPIDLLGFDACLMNMLEVDYQVRKTCRVVVGSQEVEPGDGWPYDRILQRLAATPDVVAEKLGTIIVESYIDYYRTEHPTLAVTQSAVSVGNLAALNQAVDRMAQALLMSIQDKRTQMLVSWAQKFAQFFSDPEYYDLAHLCMVLAEEDRDSPVGIAAREVLSILNGANSPLLANGSAGVAVQDAHGLSIYLPGRLVSPLYGRLDFAIQNRWDDFLYAYVDLH